MSEVFTKGKKAKEASLIIQNNTTDEKNKALEKIAEQLIIDQKEILEANKLDLDAGRKDNLPESTLDRMMLNEERIKDISNGVKDLMSLNDPIGEVLESITRDNGLKIEKIRVPLGVIGMIYESRPNVTVDAAALCLKAGNAVILRGSSSAKHSNVALVKSIHRALEQSKVPTEAVQLIEDTSRENAQKLFNLTEYLDVLIPRGGEGLIKVVVENSTVPVLETGAGNCHLYIDASAPYEKAEPIAVNAKVQRPSVCNAIEGLLVEKSWFEKHGESLLKTLDETHKIELIGDEKVKEIYPSVKEATEEDWKTEYLDTKLSVKVVDDVEEAINFINTYGTGHSEAIVTEDEKNAERFLSQVDATSVYHNASTRFTDGAEFGYGAEIGISTQKLHARGPMGLPALTSTKFVVRGTNQIRE